MKNPQGWETGHANAWPKEGESRPTMHEDAGQVQLHLEAHIHIGSVDCWRPPESEAPIRDLVQTTPLCIGQLLVLPA